MALCCLLQSATAQVSFEEITNQPFLDNTAYLNGVSWIDVDNDHDLDICVSGFRSAAGVFVNASAIFLNDGTGNFSASTPLSSNQKNAMRHSWADIDNDDDLDLYLAATWNQGDINELWINNNGASLQQNQATGATPNTALPYEGTVNWVDYNNDGWVDLFLPRWNDQRNRLFRNTGNGAFAEVTNMALVNDLAWTTGGYWGDYDNDGDQDVFVVNYQIGPSDPGNNDLFRNDGNGSFTKITTAGPIVSTPARGRSANWVDVNNDGRLDLYVCNQFGEDYLHINNGNGTFSTQFINDNDHTSWSSNWGDFDNDGDQDLISIGFWNTDGRFYQNDGQGNLTDVTDNFSNIFPLTTSGSNSNGIIWADADLDGWLDLHITQPDAAEDRFFKNLGAPCRSWLEVICIGQESNHAAIGARVSAKAIINGAAVWQTRQISSQTASTGTNPMWQHFGFGDAGVIDSLVVQWPSGKICTFTQIPIQQLIEIRENCTTNTIKSVNNQEGSLQEVTRCLPVDSITLMPNAPAGGTWTADCGTCISPNGVFNATALNAGQYLVQYNQGTVCDGSIDSFLITLIEAPTVVVNGPDTLDFAEQAVLSASGAAEYQWSPAAGSLSCSDCASPLFTADTTILFVVTGVNDLGCSDTAHLLVVVLPEPKVEMPNAFTPNGDQKNDVFRPTVKANLFEDYKLKVYSRWGERIFESFDIGEAWDGTVNGLPAPSDVYVFTFEYKLVSGESGYINNEVTLLR